MASIALWRSLNSSCVTRMRPSVSVPVLSVQITVTEPSVSTASSLFTSPFRLRILRIPNTNITVTAMSRPSGTAATARTIETRSMSSMGRPVSTPVIMMARVTATTSLVREWLKVRNRT